MPALYTSEGYNADTLVLSTRRKLQAFVLVQKNLRHRDADGDCTRSPSDGYHSAHDSEILAFGSSRRGAANATHRHPHCRSLSSDCRLSASQVEGTVWQAEDEYATASAANGFINPNLRLRQMLWGQQTAHAQDIAVVALHETLSKVRSKVPEFILLSGITRYCHFRRLVGP